VGVPPSGPMDSLAFRIANSLAGNPESAAALECTMTGPVLRFLSDATIAIAGADMHPRIDGKPVPMWQCIEVSNGSTLRLGSAAEGARTYIAIRGGIDVPVYLDSWSTFILGKFGGHGGRTLRTGDMLRWNGVTDARLNETRTDYAIPSYSHDWK